MQLDKIAHHFPLHARFGGELKDRANADPITIHDSANMDPERDREDMMTTLMPKPKPGGGRRREDEDLTGDMETRSNDDDEEEEEEDDYDPMAVEPRRRVELGMKNSSTPAIATPTAQSRHKRQNASVSSTTSAGDAQQTPTTTTETSGTPDSHMQKPRKRSRSSRTAPGRAVLAVDNTIQDVC